MDIPTEYIHPDPAIAGHAGSYWLATSPGSPFPVLTEDLECEVLVIGGGLAGILTAFELRARGAEVALIEARHILGDVTGHTTAKLSAQHGAIYRTLEDVHDLEIAAAYGQANLSGIDRAFAIAESLGVEAELVRADSHLFAETADERSTLVAERDAAERAGLTVELVDGDPAGLPFHVEAVLRMPGQAAFHPLRFGRGVLGSLVEHGARVFESTRASDVDETDDGVKVTTPGGTITTQKVVVATNYPFHDKGSLFSRLYPYRVYALGVYLTEPLPDALYVRADDDFNLRNAPTPEGPLTVVSGVHHRAGAGGDERDCYRELLERTSARLPVDRVAWHWSTQDNRTPDHLPMIGRSPGTEHVYVVSGFAGWGMSQAFVAAEMLADVLNGVDNRLVRVFDPTRFDVSSAGTLFSENVGVAGHLVSGFARASGDVEDIGAGEGGVVRSEGRRTAVYRDEGGDAHAVSAVCTHLGCTVGFNDAEKTWDCPCHGSRFDLDGHVLHGPAVRALEPRKVREKIGAERE